MLERHARWAMPIVIVWLLAALETLISPQTVAYAAPGGRPVVAAADLLLGEWWTENNQGRIRFTRDRDGTYRGTTTCCVPVKPSEDREGRDIHNPNPKLRARSTVGIVLIWKLSYEDGEYVDGYVYNPRDGKTYRFEAKIIDQDTVKIRGYMGIPLLGQSQVWKRARVQTPTRPASGATS